MTFPEEAPCWDSDPDEEPRRSALDEGGPVPDFAAALRNLEAAVQPPTTHAPALGIDVPAPAAGPAPVPPPVDALLKLIDEIGQASHALGVAAERWSEVDMAAATAGRDVARGNIVMAARDLWAAGVEEGRQQSAGQLKKERESFGRLALLYDGAVSDGDARYAAGVAEGRRQATEERTEEVERLQVLLDHAEQYARDLQDNGDVPGRTEERAAVLREAYWKLREHASALRSTFVYTNAHERAREAMEAAREGLAMGSDGRWREKALGMRSHARGIEAGAQDLAHMLGVEEREIERPEANHG